MSSVHVRASIGIISKNLEWASLTFVIVFHCLVQSLLRRLFQAIEIQVQITQAVNNNGGKPTIWGGVG